MTLLQAVEIVRDLVSIMREVMDDAAKFCPSHSSFVRFAAEQLWTKNADDGEWTAVS